MEERRRRRSIRSSLSAENNKNITSGHLSLLQNNNNNKTTLHQVISLYNKTTTTTLHQVIFLCDKTTTTTLHQVIFLCTLGTTVCTLTWPRCLSINSFVLKYHHCSIDRQITHVLLPVNSEESNQGETKCIPTASKIRIHYLKHIPPLKIWRTLETMK